MDKALSISVAPASPSPCQAHLEQVELRSAILRLWHRNLPTSSPQRYRWLYDSSRAAAWVVADEKGGIVGAAGLLRRRLRSFDGEIEVGQPIDFTIDRLHRTVGPARRLLDALLRESNTDLLYAFSRPDVCSAAGRAGFRRLGRLNRWIKPLQVRKFLEAHLTRPLARLLTLWPLEPLLRLGSTGVRRRLPRGLRFDVLDRFDSRFDDLWEESAGQVPLIGERSAAYLDWRFAQAPGANHRVACLSGAGDSLLAYLVYSVCDGLVHVNDFLFARPEDFESLLKEFLQFVCQQDISAVDVSYLGSSEAIAVLRRLGFWKRPEGLDMMIYRRDAQPEDSAFSIYDREAWYLTRADFDIDP